MSEIADSMIFRQKMYDTFKESGLLSKLKTTLRTNLLQKLQKPSQMPIIQPQDQNKPFHLRNKFLESAIAEYLRAKKRQYSLSIFMAQCDLEEEDCLRFGELSEIISLNSPADGQSFLYRLFEQFGKVKCMQARERSTQTDFQEPLAKKLQLVEKDYRAKIDYWKLIPGSSLPKSPDLVDQQERLRGEFAIEKERLKRDLEVSLKKEIERKLQNQYSFRLQDAKKQHETRLNQLKVRQKTVIDRLTKQKEELQNKAKTMREDEKRMINKYQQKMLALQAEYRLKLKEIENKQKQFWKKELQLRAKKRQYEQTIRLVKQKVIAQSSQ